MTYNTDTLILAGGENKRIPFIKGFLEIQNRRIIERNLEILSKIFRKVVISTNTPEIYCYLGVQMVGDVLDTRGPMTGILSALINPEISDIFVTACDMPYINAILIKHITEKWDGKRDAVIPIYYKRPQPLFGMYSKRIAVRMEDSIRKGRKSLRDFLEEINVLYIHEDVVRSIDPEGRSFVNINTVKDYQREGGKLCLV